MPDEYVVLVHDSPTHMLFMHSLLVRVPPPRACTLPRVSLSRRVLALLARVRRAPPRVLVSKEAKIESFPTGAK